MTLTRAFTPLVLVALSAAAVAAQAPARPQTPAAQTQPPTFRTETTLRVWKVSVVDRSGKAVEGLTANDFVVMENGVRQDIAFATFQRLEEPLPASTPPAEIQPAPPLDAVARAAASRITIPPANDTRFQDKRLMVLYFDLSRMPDADKLRAFDSAQKYVRTNMGTSDMVAIMALQNGGVKIRQDFTADKPRLLEVLTAMMFNDDFDQDGQPDLDSFASDFGQSAEFNVFNTDRRLAALQTAISNLRPLTQQKVLVYFGSGLNANGADNAAQYVSTVNSAKRANVNISTIDTRGLVAISPVANASRQSPGGMSMFTGQAAVNSMTGFLASQDSLYALAKDTGGKALLDNNDLTTGIVDAARTANSYYLVAYYTSNNANDGKFRRVQVTVPGNKEYELAAQDGYFADKVWANLSNSEREMQMAEAFRLENPLTDMTLAMELNFFKLNRAEYYVPITVKIPGSELQIARRRGAPRTEIDFMSEVKDNNMISYSIMRDSLPITLSEDIANQLSQRPILYQTGFTLLPGDYVIKLLARDTVTGRTGTFQAKFTVPNLEKDFGNVPISSVVLSGQRMTVGSEIFAVKNGSTKEVQAVDPLIHDGQRMIPSVTRVFSVGRDLFVYLQAYQPGATTMRPMMAFVSFYRGGEKVFETAPMSMDGPMDARSKAVPMRFSLPMGKLEPGEYECQVTVLDPGTQRASFWRAPLTLVP